jgi:hypothetical protein
VALLLFAAIGRGNHGEAVASLELLKTAGPFIAGWLLAAPLTGAFAADACSNKVRASPATLVLRKLGGSHRTQTTAGGAVGQQTLRGGGTACGRPLVEQSPVWLQVSTAVGTAAKNWAVGIPVRCPRAQPHPWVCSLIGRWSSRRSPLTGLQR